MSMKPNIVLIGFMGTGKSSIGRKLARILNMEFIDTDQEIERLTGLTIPLIFAKYGEIRFRSEEKLMVKKVVRKNNCVISTGGGVVLDPNNIAELKKTGIIICLMASPQEIYARVKRRGGRPLLRNRNSPEAIAQLLEERAPYYRCADFYVDTTHLSTGAVLEQILQFLKERGFGNGENSS